MARAAPVQHCFRFIASWQSVVLLVGLNAGTLVVGAALILLGQSLLPAQLGWRALAVGTLYALGGTVVITSGCFLALGFWIVIVRLLRVPVVRVTADGFWIAHLGWRAAFIAFDSVKWVKRELPMNGVEYVVLVHGPDLKTESVGSGEIGQTDYDTLLALLAERCPDAFTEDPSAGWRMPH